LDLSLKASSAITDAAGGTRRSWLGALRVAWANAQLHLFALADQAVVSGASFAMTVLIGRWTSPTELGLYAIGISALVMWVNVQESFISRPYTIQRHDNAATDIEHAGSSLILGGLMAALAVLLMLVTAAVLATRAADSKVVTMVLAMALAVPFVLLREFGRRFAFTQLRSAQALLLDASVLAIQFVALGWLGSVRLLSSATACLALGGACALASVAWLYIARRSFSINFVQVPAAMQQYWGLGKWLFALEITVMLQIYVTYWLSALLIGATAAGILAASMSVASFANPVILGLSNILMPRAVLAFRQAGAERLRRQAIWDALLLAGAVALFVMILLFAGEKVMRLLYNGGEYGGQGVTVVVLALALMAWAGGMPASNALAIIGRPRVVVWIGLISVVLTTAIAWWLTQEAGLVGVAYGFLAGHVAGVAGRWFAFLTIVVRQGPEKKHCQGGGSD
jgi:O-antigen/teichoic acid export membrane protein